MRSELEKALLDDLEGVGEQVDEDSAEVLLDDQDAEDDLEEVLRDYPVPATSR